MKKKKLKKLLTNLQIELEAAHEAGDSTQSALDETRDNVVYYKSRCDEMVKQRDALQTKVNAQERAVQDAAWKSKRWNLFDGNKEAAGENHAAAAIAEFIRKSDASLNDLARLIEKGEWRAIRTDAVAAIEQRTVATIELAMKEATHLIDCRDDVLAWLAAGEWRMVPSS